MNDYFTNNFVDYDDPPLDSNSGSEDKDFSLTTPNSDSTGLFALSAYSPQIYNNNVYQAPDQLNFDMTNYYGQQQEVPVQNDVPEKSKKGGRSKKVKAEEPVSYTDSPSSSSEGKILDKSKRIQKREIAKERTKQKTDIAAMFAGVDAKFLPEGYDDPNLDERTKKKMIQMVRNRISAQNSRDRKKGYITQLEEQTAQLEAELKQVTAERDALAGQLQNAQEEIERLRNSGLGTCQNCNGNTIKEEEFLITNNGDNHNIDDIPAGGFSGLSSPRLVRFASSRTGLFGMFAFIGFVCFLALSNVGENGLVNPGNGLNQLGGARILDIQSANQVPGAPYKGKVSHVTIDIPDYSKSMVLQNIHQIMSNFEQNYEPTFKAHLQKHSYFSGLSVQESLKILEKGIQPIKIEKEEEPKNGLVQYGSIRNPKFRKTIPQLTHNNPPALNQMVNGDPITSTLFCSSGAEFSDNGNQKVHVTESGKGDLARNTTLDLEKAEYLQLLVPKGTIMKANINNKLTDIYGQAIYTDNQTDDTMLEIWCKVFMVRELGASY